MRVDLLIAGYGGQGVLFGGTLLAQAAMLDGLQTTWFPSYGAEMRGGTANSAIIFSDEAIGSPIVDRPSALLALNEASMVKYLPRCAPGAIVVANASLIAAKPEYCSFGIRFIEATEIADRELHDVRTANAVMAGAFIRIKGLPSLTAALSAVESVLVEKPALIEINKKALQLGYDRAGGAL